jgi:translocation and assembly module TamB
VKYPKLIVTGLILAALFGAAAWLAGTTSGLRFIAARALPHVPVTYDPAGVEGRLVGPLAIGPIELAAPGVRGTIGAVQLDWRAAALFSRTLHVLDLHIAEPRIEIERQPTGDSTDAPQDAAQFRLPLSVVLERLQLRDGELRLDGQSIVSGLQLDLASRAVDQRLELLHLEIDSAEGSVSGHAQVSFAPAEAWDVDLNWRLLTEDGPIAGHMVLRGTLERLEVEQRFTEPMESRVAGTISGLPNAPAWQLDLDLEPLESQAGPWPETLAGLAARLRIEGRLEDSTITGQVELPQFVPGPIDVDLAAGWENGVATIRRLALGLADGARLDGSGQLTPGETLAAEFTLDGTGLGWPLGESEQLIEAPRVALQGGGAAGRWEFTLEGRARREGLPEVDVSAAFAWMDSVLDVERVSLISPEGEIRATASGTLDTREERLDYRVVAEADARLPEYPPVSMQFTAAGDAQGVQVETLAAQLLDGRLDGAGRITWDGEEAADFRLTFSDLDPSSLAPDWPGRLAGSLEIRGFPAGDEGLEIVVSSLRGELRSMPLNGTGAVNLTESSALLRRSRLSIGAASLEANGRLDEDTVALDAIIDVPSLGALHDAARGALTATVRIGGARNAPRLALEADGARLGWGDARARTLRIDAMADLTGEEASRIMAELEGFATAPGPGGILRLDADGTPDDHRLRVELQQARPEQRFELNVAGRLEGDHWAGRINGLSVEQEQQEIWALQGPAAIHAGPHRVSLGDACMAGTLGLLCVQGVWDRDGPWSGQATLGELDLGPLTEWLLAGLLARGIVTGQIVVEADEDHFLALTGGLELTAGDIRLAEEDSVPLLAWEGGVLTLEGDETAARMTLDLALAGADEVTGRLTIGWNEPDPPLDGLLEARLAQLHLITELLPDLSDLEGQATAQASIGGTLKAPRLVGRFEWVDGKAQIPTLGLQPEDIDVLAELAEGVLSFRASGRSGEGAFEADGRFDLGADAIEGEATLQGEGLLLANLPEARLTASPDLKMRYSGREIVITGGVSIPFGRISGVGGPGAVTASPDEVIVGPRARATEDDIQVKSRIRVTVGPDVRVQASGLQGQVEGNLLTVTEPQALPWGRGELRVVDGTFSTFGQRLEIETGRLIYTGGPLENPGLEIRAIRKVDEVTAGALVRGTLQQPEISVYSEPPLPRAEALSYLTLGKSLDQLQAGEQSTVNQAANSLAMSGGGLIARDLGRRLGFDDVSVAADDDTGGTAVVVGKYLGAGLYVSYGLGLFDTVNTLRLRYQINRRLSVEATSGLEAAADLFYTFERD